MSKWSRKQDFYKPSTNGKINRCVQFYCRRYDKIKAVEVIWMYEKLKVSIYPTHAGDQLLKTKILLSPHYNKVEVRNSSYFSDLMEYNLYLNNKNSLALVIELLTVLGDEKEIITELNNIFHFIYSYDSTILYKHIVESNEHKTQNFNFSKSMRLVSLFKEGRSYSDRFSEKETKEMDDLLMSGANPNIKMGSDTLLSFCLRVLMDAEQTIIKLLIYGADPFEYTEYNMRCPYYEAVSLGQHHILKFFDEVGYRRSKGMSTLRIQDDIYRDGDAIITRFTFPDGRIYRTCLKKNVDLTLEEKRTFIDMYKTHFPKHGNVQAAEQAAIEDIEGENTLVEAIMCEDLLVGMNIFRKLFQENKIVSFEVSICVLKPEHRGNPLVPLLAYRIPCTLQLILQDHDICVMQSMVNPIALIKLYKDVLNTSKYHSPIFDGVLSESVNISLDGKVPIIRKGMTCYVDGQVEINSPPRPLVDQILYERYFYEVLLGLPAGSASTQGRAHPSVCLVDDRFVSALLELTTYLNFYRHIILLAKCMGAKDVSNATLVALNKNGTTLFHTGKREVGTLQLPVARL